MSRIGFLVQLLSPRGRCDRRGLLWLALALLAIQGGLFAMVWQGLFDPRHPMFIAAKLAFLWIAITAAAKRLHDTGRSAWWILWTALFVIVWTIAVTLGAVFIVGPDAGRVDGAAMPVMIALVMLPILAATLWLHFKRGDAVDNRYGSVPTSAGFSLPATRQGEAVQPGGSGEFAHPASA